MIKRTLCASIFSLALLNNVYALPTPNYENVPEYLVALDGQTYFGINAPFFQGDRPLPEGYTIVIRCFKSKGTIDPYDLGDKWNEEKQKALDAKEILPDSAWEDFEKYCEENLDFKDYKDYEPQVGFDTFIKEGYLPTFRSYWALKTPEGKLIPAMWLLDPNHKALTDIAKKPGDKTPILVWKNPEYKQPDATCKPGEGVAASESKEIGASLPQTTKEFIFEGSGFSQKFQVVATAEEVAAVPGGLETISERVVQLFKDMPKVGATIIGRMVTADGTLGVCPIVDEIEGQQFKAAIMFAADTTVDQAKALADDLDKKFNVLKEKVMNDMKGDIDAEHQRLMEEHTQKLAYHEARAEAAKQGDVNVGSGVADGSVDDKAAKAEAKELAKAQEKQRNQQDLLQGINGLQQDVDGAISVLNQRSSTAGSEGPLAQPVFG